MLHLLAILVKNIFVYECIGIELVSAIFYLKSIGIGLAAKKLLFYASSSY